MTDIRPRSLGRAVLAAFAVAALSACVSCSPPFAPSGDREIEVLSWNLLNLFDPVDAGTEYDDWTVADGDWSEADYRLRLSLAAKVVLACADGGPEVLLLQELENLRVLDDLAAGPLARARYFWRVVAGDPGSRPAAVRVGVLSKFPIVAARSHSAALADGSVADRAVLEVELDVHGTPLVALVNHWKSRSDGEEATEGERRAQAGLVSRLVAERLAARPNLALVVAGDLNEDPAEFDRVDWPTALVPAERARERPVLEGRLLFAGPGAAFEGLDEPVLVEPWIGADGFTYSYRDSRDRLDHLLCSPGLFDATGLELEGFGVPDLPFLYGPDGLPFPWNPVLRDGYSDHLPVVATLARVAP